MYAYLKGNIIEKPKIDWSDIPEEKRLKKVTERYTEQFGYEKSLALKRCLNEILQFSQRNDIVVIGIKYPFINFIMKK